MIPDYFTSYTRQLEWVEAFVAERQAALTAFENEVKNDWELTRKKKALKRLDEVKNTLENFFGTLADYAKATESIKSSFPFDPMLSRQLTNIWNSTSPSSGRGTEEEMINSIFRNPTNASQLLEMFEKIRTEIGTVTLPAEKTATEYVDERINEAIREAFRKAVTFQPYQPTEPRIFRKAT